MFLPKSTCAGSTTQRSDLERTTSTSSCGEKRAEWRKSILPNLASLRYRFSHNAQRYLGRRDGADVKARWSVNLREFFFCDPLLSQAHSNLLRASLVCEQRNIERIDV